MVHGRHASDSRTRDGKKRHTCVRGHVAHSGTSAGSHIGLCSTTLSVYDSCTGLVPNGASSVYDSGVSEVGVWVIATWSVQDSIPTAVGASCVCVCACVRTSAA